MHAGSIVNTVSFKSASQSPQTVVKTYLIFWGFDDYGSLYRGLECNECSGFSVQEGLNYQSRPKIRSSTLV